MAHIKCKNCGRTYRYETEGCCPACGAYNRPPRREQVNADGTIYHINNSNYLEARHAQAKTHSGKVCFEEKECFEEKVCYEQKTHSKKSPTVAAHSFNQTKQRRSEKKKNKTITVFFGVLAILFSIGTLIGALKYDEPSYDDVISYEEPYITQYTVTDGVATVYLENAADAEDGLLFYYEQGDEFCIAEIESCEHYDDQCIMTFPIDDDYKYAESVTVLYGNDDWVDLSIDSVTVENE